MISGYRTYKSLYEVSYLQRKLTTLLCDKKTLDSDDIERFVEFAADGYRQSLILDGLPVISPDKDTESGYLMNIPVGKYFEDGNKVQLYNHLALEIQWHEPESKGRIVGFIATPHSLDWSAVDYDTTTDILNVPPLVIALEEQDGAYATSADVLFTYTVDFEMSDKTWASRWQVVIENEPSGMRIAGIAFTSLVILFLSVAVGLLVLGIFKADVMRYAQDLAREEAGWKLLAPEVFRAPAHSALLCALFGLGWQLFAALSLTAILTLAGAVSPADPGSFTTALLICGALCGVIGGYTGARGLVTLRLSSQTRQVATLMMGAPALCFGAFLVSDLIFWAMGSTSAVPLSAIGLLVLLWCLHAVTTVAGVSTGVRRPAAPLPCQRLPIPRPIPQQDLWLRRPVLELIASCAPSLAVFSEFSVLVEVLMEGGGMYFLGATIGLLIIDLVVSAEVAIVVIFTRLSHEDHRWHWSAFSAPSLSGIWLSLTAFGYFTPTEAPWPFFVVSVLYSVLIGGVFALTAGSIGLTAGHAFCYVAYGLIKSK
ncbi:nonaspanin [Kipferlia bialata]|uniref:Transmembrane 9 superfamily member n=1 Tax=Kipferlia bialata TaxID=797122 RepID=A0A9K3CVY4_9EUKA|nr:nonaspanin [Kipferlia bialata]|eukprot:g4606.t1